MLTGNDDGIETAAAFEIGFVGRDKGLGIGAIRSTHEKAKGVANDGLPDPIGLRQTVDQIERICDFTIEATVPRSAQVSARVEAPSCRCCGCKDRHRALR